MKVIFVMLFAMLCFAQTGCGSGGRYTSELENGTALSAGSAGPAPGNSNLTNIAAGTELYSQNCAPCHGALASSTIAGANSSMVFAALQNVPSMQVTTLISLTSTQVAQIAAALGGT